MNRWLKLLAAASLSLALVGAPCRNCEPKPAKAQAQHCQHDCCPKPKPEKPACKWQPADYAAVEVKLEAPAAPEAGILVAVAGLVQPAASWRTLDIPQAQSEPPPLFLAHRQLRI